MIPRLCLVFASTLLLCACSGGSGMFAFEDTPPPAPAAMAQAPAAPAQAADDAWCQRVAASDRVRAQAAGYDPATLDRMTLTSFQQCRLLSAE